MTTKRFTVAEFDDLREQFSATLQEVAGGEFTEDEEFEIEGVLAEIVDGWPLYETLRARAGEMETLLRDLLEENARRYGYADSADAEREAREYEEEGRPLSAEQVRREVGLDRIAPLLSSIDQEKA